MYHVLRREGNKGLAVGPGGEWHPIAYYSRILSRDVRKRVKWLASILCSLL